MLLRYRADHRTVLLMFGLAPSVMAAQYLWPSSSRYLIAPSLYFGIAAAIIAHNHNHSPTFTSARVNDWFNKWLSIFYGYPTFAFIPTHNLSHHRRVNRPGDSTITWRLSNRHSLFIAVSYFFVSGFYQQEPIARFVRRAKRHNPRLYSRIRSQVVWFALGNVGLIALATARHGLNEGLQVWMLATLLPALFALWAVQLLS